MSNVHHRDSLGCARKLPHMRPPVLVRMANPPEKPEEELISTEIVIEAYLIWKGKARKSEFAPNLADFDLLAYFLALVRSGLFSRLVQFFLSHTPRLPRQEA